MKFHCIQGGGLELHDGGCASAENRGENQAMSAVELEETALRLLDVGSIGELLG
jgi:hypothetical protein